MGSSKLRRAIEAVKDQTSISLAKVSTSSSSLSDLKVAIVKATRHRPYPAKERHIQQILTLTCYSRHHVASCVKTISRRLNKTRNWVVALKILILVRRLLQDGNPAYEHEVFMATRRGTRLLNMSDFRDASRPKAWEYSAFVRTYALFLDEQLQYRLQGRLGRRCVFSYVDHDEEDEPLGPGTLLVRTTPVHEMTNSRVFSRTYRLMRLLDCFLACRPIRSAENHRMVILALRPIVKQSFQIYYDLTEVTGVLLDRFVELDAMECMKVLDIFCRVAKQYDELDMFYEWCKRFGIARSSEFPEVVQISQKKLDLMDEFINEKIEGKHEKQEPEPEPESKPEPEPEPEPEQEMNTVKALPASEGFEEEEQKKTQEIGDLLNLEDDVFPPTEDQADKLALAIFGPCPGPEKSGTPWEAFDDLQGDWETALVESASQLSRQQPSLPNGFDTLVLDGMYEHGTASAAMVNPGSASSVVFGRPEMLALPAPPSANGELGDPFAPSLAVAPPSYVQMSDMEKKQRLLMEEQMMWHQQQQVGFPHNPYHPYNAGVYAYHY